MMLPNGIAEKAIKNTLEGQLKIQCPCLPSALAFAFIKSKSNEGGIYWEEVLHMI